MRRNEALLFRVLIMTEANIYFQKKSYFIEYSRRRVNSALCPLMQKV